MLDSRLTPNMCLTPGSQMIDFPFKNAELAEDYIPVPKEEAMTLSRSVDDIKSLKGMGAEDLSVVTCFHCEATETDAACYEWFHATITTQVSKKFLGWCMTKS